MTDTPFQAGGPLSSNSPVYIERRADREALQHLRQMYYIQLTEPRQQGKTSLIYRLLGALRNSVYRLAYVDAESLKSKNETGWYRDLAVRLIGQLQSSVKCDKLPVPTDASTWRLFLSNLVSSEPYAANCKPRLIIAIDEVGSIPFGWAEDFFRVLREVYVIREVESYFQYLTFVLAGAFDPRDLISDSKISPFNVAQRVNLEDFNCEQVGQLVAYLGLPADQTAAVAERIHYWTSGQPYLTQKLCLYLAEQDDISDVDAVDVAVDRFFCEDTNHLPRIVEDMEEDAKLLNYIRQAVADRVKFTPSVNPRHFRLAHVIGVIKPDERGCCRIRNCIYERALQAGIESAQPTEPHSPLDKYHYDAFISYSHHDKEWVHSWLLPRLEAAGLRVCIDFRDFEPGLPSLVNMENAVECSHKTLIVLTPEWVASEWTTFESLLIQTDDPAGRRARMIPLRLKPCEPPKRIAMLTYLDFAQAAEAKFQLQRLVAAICTEPKSDQPSPTLQPVSPKASDLRLLVADPSGKQLVSHLEFSIPSRDPSRKLAYEIVFRLYLDNQGQTMARYVVIDMAITSDTDFFLAYDYEGEPFLIEEAPRRWQITLSNTYGQCYFEGGADFVCHSKVHQRLGLVKMLVPYGQPDTTVTFRYRILAEGYESRGSFVIMLKLESLKESSI